MAFIGEGIMAKATIEIQFTRAPSGVSENGKRVLQVRPRTALETLPEAVERQIRSFRPRRTDVTGRYSFDSPTHGTGTISVSMPSNLSGERFDEKVQVLEIERLLGPQPGRFADNPTWMNPIRAQVNNPYLVFAIGLLALIFGTFPFINILFVRDMDASGSVFFALLGAILLGLGVFFMGRAMKRMCWWHRARAEVKRRGDKMPEDLRLFF